MRAAAVIWWLQVLCAWSTCHTQAFPTAPKKVRLVGGGKNLKLTGVQHLVGRPTSSSRKYRSASREGGLPDARGRRCRAAQPRASLHRTKIPQAGRMATLPCSTVAHRPAPHAIVQTADTARDAGQFRAPTRPRTVRNPLASPRRLVGRSLGPSFFSGF